MNQALHAQQAWSAVPISRLGSKMIEVLMARGRIFCRIRTPKPDSGTTESDIGTTEFDSEPRGSSRRYLGEAQRTTQFDIRTTEFDSGTTEADIRTTDSVRKTSGGSLSLERMLPSNPIDPRVDIRPPDCPREITTISYTQTDPNLPSMLGVKLFFDPKPDWPTVRLKSLGLPMRNAIRT